VTVPLEFAHIAEHAAIVISHLAVFPDGWSIALRSVQRAPRTMDDEVEVFESFESGVTVATNMSIAFPSPWRIALGRPFIRRMTGGVRFGIEFSDGARVTDIEPLHPMPPEFDTPDYQPMWGLELGGSHGDSHSMRTEVWVWPVPPAGDASLVVAWPEQDIAEQRCAIDGDHLRAGRDRSRALWPDEASLPSRITNVQQGVHFARGAQARFQRDE
jgi:hypothetical protein